MGGLTILEEIRIASPCEADWETMAGDDRSRFCSDCSKHVYNIAAMTADEATRLIIATEGRLCLQIYRRTDGTVLTADCPVGLGRVSRGRRFRRALAMGLVLPALVVAGVTAQRIGGGAVEPFPTGPNTTWSDRLDWALIRLGLKSPAPSVMVGQMLRGMPSAMTLPLPVPVEPEDEGIVDPCQDPVQTSTTPEGIGSPRS